MTAAVLEGRVRRASASTSRSVSCCKRTLNGWPSTPSDPPPLQSLQRSRPLGAHLQGDKAGQGAGPDAEVSRCLHLDDRGGHVEDGEEVLEVVAIRGQHGDVASA